MQERLSEVISYGMELGATFVDVRLQKIERTTINLIDGKGQAISGSDGGTAIRILADGAWGFASIVSMELDVLKSGVRDAYHLAKLGANHIRDPIDLYPVEPKTDDVQIKLQVDPREIPTEEKKQKLVDLHRSMKNPNKQIISSTISYADIVGKQYYQSSDGRQITLDKCITWARILVNGKDGTIRAGGREELASPYGYWVFNDNHLNEIGERLVTRVKRNLEAGQAKGGSFPAILGPPVTGVLAHEACGHLFEADLTQNGVIGTALGQTIGSPYATIIDSGVHPDGIGAFAYDDEGIEAQETKILDKGRVNALLTDREYAQKFASISARLSEEQQIVHTPSGNARAFDFRVRPLIRMRNTYFAPGDMTWEELLEPIKYGYYCTDFRGGQASLEGTFTIGVQEAYEIVDGELGKPVRGVSLSGNTLETLHGISGIAKGDVKLNPGRCGKIQAAFTGDGGPLGLRVDSINVSAEK
ncbi:MAG: metallopeptidase TldD-related protein [Candidatus Thorarchaeota archaeon]